MRIINQWFLFLLLIPYYAVAQPSGNLTLWYNQPSGLTWENALPIGNGRLGAMIYGNVDKEIIQLNEHSVWSGSPNRNDNPEALQKLDSIRQLLFDGKQKEAENLANRSFITKKSHGQKFQPVGNLNILFPGHENYTNYYRELDIDKAVTKTKYTVDQVNYTREAFASMSDRVIVMKVTANKPGKISFSAYFSSPHIKKTIGTTAGRDLTLSGLTSTHETIEGKIKFKGITRIKLDGGTLSVTDTSVIVNNANSATLFISIATNFINYADISGNEEKMASAFLDRAFQKAYTTLLSTHIAAYQKYFHRVKIDLGKTPGPDLPTDQRLKNFRNTTDPDMVELYYQYGRYLLISSSQPGGQPANLQGIWNHRFNPPWDSKYTININAEMNYWPAERTNLAEMHLPFLEMIKELSYTGKETARIMYGARGWVAHHNTDIWRINGAIDGAFWGMWPSGGGWLCQHLWEHYLYSGDKNYLASVYPAIKEAALFFVDFLIKHPAYPWMVVSPSTSPENAPKAHGGSSLDAGVTMDNQIVFDIFSIAIHAAHTLQKDSKFTDTLMQLRSQLPPMQIGKHNQLQEWLDDIDDPDDHHRHVSHLYGLFPSNQISAYRTPELFAASKNTLMQRGDVSTGWSMGWKVNWWAKLQDGNHAYKLIQNQLTPLGVNPEGGGTYTNLFDAHPPFQIDGNFGCTAGITEMLVQCSDGEVHILPALPDAWSAGSIKGIRLRGGFEIIDLQWVDGKITRLNIKSNLGGNLRLRLPNEIKTISGGILKPVSSKNPNPFYYVDDTAMPLISKQATIKPLELKPTWSVDIATKKSQSLHFIGIK